MFVDDYTLFFNRMYLKFVNTSVVTSSFFYMTLGLGLGLGLGLELGLGLGLEN